LKGNVENNVALVVKFLKGHCEGHEIENLTEWVRSDPENARLYDEICDIWNASSKGRFDSLDALNRVKKRITGNQPEKNTLPKYALFRVAAVIVLVLVSGVLAYMIASKARGTPSDTITEITVPMGSKSKILLPDGTKVILNSGSLIRYSNRFNMEVRELTMEGEAYFDVVHNPRKPFIVRTTDITIKVLGTIFNIKAYPTEGSVETTLISGSLIVEKQLENNKTEETRLLPNQRATYIRKHGTVFLNDTDHESMKRENVKNIEHIKGKVLLAQKVETDIFTSWKDNRLVFRNEAFQSLVVRLERWYGVKINILDDDLNKFHFNGTIENETIQDVLQFINYTIPIDYTIDHNQITIKIKSKPE
jgi:transmembrane sensor